MGNFTYSVEMEWAATQVMQHPSDFENQFAPKRVQRSLVMRRKYTKRAPALPDEKLTTTDSVTRKGG